MCWRICSARSASEHAPTGPFTGQLKRPKSPPAGRRVAARSQGPGPTHGGRGLLTSFSFHRKSTACWLPASPHRGPYWKFPVASVSRTPTGGRSHISMAARIPARGTEATCSRSTKRVAWRRASRVYRISCTHEAAISARVRTRSMANRQGPSEGLDST
jgi:hypothetical protein